MPVFPHVDTQMAMKIATAITVLAVLLTSWLRARRRRPTVPQPPSAHNPWQVTPAPRQFAAPTRVAEEPAALSQPWRRRSLQVFSPSCISPSSTPAPETGSWRMPCKRPAATERWQSKRCWTTCIGSTSVGDDIRSLPTAGLKHRTPSQRTIANRIRR